MPPLLQGDFLTFFGVEHLSVVCQASVRGLKRQGAGMQFEEQVSHRFRELGLLEPRDWFACPEH